MRRKNDGVSKPAMQIPPGGGLGSVLGETNEILITRSGTTKKKAVLKSVGYKGY
jgi:hypothetical protein